MKEIIHTSDCALHNGPAYEPGPCDCGASDFKQYRRSQIAELRPYVVGESTKNISISRPDKEAGSPKSGDMIARNPKNHDDQWLVAARYFMDNFEPLPFPPAPGSEAT